jgi:hypothetical protein
MGTTCTRGPVHGTVTFLSKSRYVATGVRDAFLPFFLFVYFFFSFFGVSIKNSSIKLREVQNTNISKTEVQKYTEKVSA